MEKERLAEILTEQFQEAHSFLLDIEDMPSQHQMPVMSEDMQEAYNRLMEVGRAHYKQYIASEALSDLSGEPRVEAWKRGAAIAKAEMEGGIKALKHVAKSVFGVDTVYFMDAIRTE